MKKKKDLDFVELPVFDTILLLPRLNFILISVNTLYVYKGDVACNEIYIMYTEELSDAACLTRRYIMYFFFFVNYL